MQESWFLLLFAQAQYIWHNTDERWTVLGRASLEISAEGVSQSKSEDKRWLQKQTIGCRI